jgi:Kelch motif
MEETMLGLVKTLAFVSVLVPVAALAGSGSSAVPGTWRTLPAAPVSIPQGPVSVWAGDRLVLLGRAPIPGPSADVAQMFDPATKKWRRLTPPAGPGYVPGYQAVWTGKEVLAFGAFHSVAYEPKKNVWRDLRKAVPGGIVLWTGREAIGWGGGCCGDVQSNGAAYNPVRNTYRDLPRSPLAPSQRPIGVWTGREVVLFVSGFSPDGKPYPASKARAAAYNPTTNTWRRIAPLPGGDLRFTGSAVWDGHEVLVAGTGRSARSAYAFDPATNRWRTLAPLPARRIGAGAVWTGSRLFLWGGLNFAGTKSLRDGVAYDPSHDRWSRISPAPVREGVSVVWSGRSMIVVDHAAAAAFTPVVP